MPQLSQNEQEWINHWLRKASSGLWAAEWLLKSPEFPSEVAFYCQQAAQKYLKAWLTTERQEPPRTRDLDKLINLVAGFINILPNDEQLADFLTPYAVLSRYPSDDENEPIVTGLSQPAYHFRNRFRPTLAQASSTGPYPAN